MPEQDYAVHIEYGELKATPDEICERIMQALMRLRAEDLVDSPFTVRVSRVVEENDAKDPSHP